MSEPLKQTALYHEHVRLGGRIIDFGGWSLPVQYKGVMQEHLACRKSVGIFDVSHMGEFTVEGPKSLDFLQWLVTNDVSKIGTGQAQYTVMCRASGGIVDDLLIYKRGDDRFLLVVNASNTDKDFAHAQEILEGFSGKSGVTLKNVSSAYTQIAVQGRNAASIIQPLVNTQLGPIKTYWFSEGHIGKVPTIIARTGYTGEDGFELYVPWSDGPEVWNKLLESGSRFGIEPCGLGARDTLRLEMKYSLYGHEITEETHPLEAGLGWVTKLDKPDFVGKKSLLEAKARGINRTLVGLRLTERGVARQGYSVFSPDGQNIGVVTSGSMSPSLNAAIAIAFVNKEFSEIGKSVAIQIRDNRVAAEIVPTPFYKRDY